MGHIADWLPVNFHSALLDQAVSFCSRRHAAAALKNLCQLNSAFRSYLMFADFRRQLPLAEHPLKFILRFPCRILAVKTRDDRVRELHLRLFRMQHARPHFFL